MIPQAIKLPSSAKPSNTRGSVCGAACGGGWSCKSELGVSDLSPSCCPADVSSVMAHRYCRCPIQVAFRENCFTLVLASNASAPILSGNLPRAIPRVYPFTRGVLCKRAPLFLSRLRRPLALARSSRKRSMKLHGINPLRPRSRFGLV